MVFPSLRCPVARTRPEGRLRQPPWLKVMRVAWRRRRNQSSATPKVEKLDIAVPAPAVSPMRQRRPRREQQGMDGDRGDLTVLSLGAAVVLLVIL